MNLEFELVPQKLPIAEKLKKQSKYDKVLMAFAGSKETSVRVDAPGIDYKTLSAGLKNRIKTGKFKSVRVHIRKDQVFLTKD